MNREDIIDLGREAVWAATVLRNREVAQFRCDQFLQLTGRPDLTARLRAACERLVNRGAP